MMNRHFSFKMPGFWSRALSFSSGCDEVLERLEEEQQRPVLRCAPIVAGAGATATSLQHSDDHDDDDDDDDDEEEEDEDEDRGVEATATATAVTFKYEGEALPRPPPPVQQDIRVVEQPFEFYQPGTLADERPSIHSSEFSAARYPHTSAVLHVSHHQPRVLQGVAVSQGYLVSSLSSRRPVQQSGAISTPSSELSRIRKPPPLPPPPPLSSRSLSPTNTGMTIPTMFEDRSHQVVTTPANLCYIQSPQQQRQLPHVNGHNSGTVRPLHPFTLAGATSRPASPPPQLPPLAAAAAAQTVPLVEPLSSASISEVISPQHTATFLPTTSEEQKQQQVIELQQQQQQQPHPAVGSQDQPLNLTSIKTESSTMGQDHNADDHVQAHIHAQAYAQAHTHAHAQHHTPCRKDKTAAKKGGKGETFNTAEYQLKRERNNIAVRKSREKAKKNFLELQRKERHLQEENIRLDNLVESLTKELDKMRALYASLRETGIVDDGTTF